MDNNFVTLDFIIKKSNKIKLRENKTKSKNLIQNIKKIDDNKYNYKIRSKKVHKNVTIDDELVNMINKKSIEYNISFSAMMNIILRYVYENNFKIK